MKDSKKGLNMNTCDHKGKRNFNKQEESNPKRKRSPQSKNTLNRITRIHTFSKNPKYYKAIKHKKRNIKKCFSFSFKDLKN